VPFSVCRSANCIVFFSIIHRLMGYAVSTGAAPATLALASLISAVFNHESNGA
jgi:hypothetical protein